MGKKKRILLNPKKFGKKYFEVLDNLDGTDDNQIKSSVVPLTIRTLNLTDNGDRTVKITAEIYGSGSSMQQMGYVIQVSGGAAVGSDINSTEAMTIGSSGSTGFLYSTSLPAAIDGSSNIMVFPEGKVTVKALLARTAGSGNPGLYADHSTATATFTESVTVSAANIGLTTSQLSGALSGNVGSSWDGTAALGLDLDSMDGTGVQHGSGSGVGSSDAYSPTSQNHGYFISVSGAANGELTLTNSGSLNGHSDSGILELLSASAVEALTPETLTVTFTPRDVNNTLSTDQAASYIITIID